MNEFAHRNARAILFLLVALGVGGAFSILSTPVGLFPRTTFPRVVVSLDAGDRPADRMEIEVTVPVEEAVRSVPGTRHVRSQTSRGSAEISIDFDWSTDMVSALLMVQSAVNGTMSSLPAGTSFDVRRMDPTTFPVIAYSLSSDTASLSELRDIALYQIRPLLATIPGVAKVGVVGGKTREYQVLVDPDQAQALNLSLDDIAKALKASNTVAAVGRLEDRGRLYLVLSDTRFDAFDQLENTVIKTNAGGIVRLEDVGTVRQATKPEWIRVTADGHQAVLVQLYQQLNGDTVKIAAGARQQIATLEKRLPPGIHFSNWYDQSELIRASALSVRDALGIGVVLAFLVMVGFLGSFRISIIVVVTVPLTLAITSLLLSWRGLTFNIMTLGGMAAAVGLIVDDALVMIEHMVRRWPALEGTPTERAIAASREFTKPLAGSSAATVIIFAPLAFLSGVTGAFFRVLSITIAIALVVSFLVAWLAIPLAGARLLARRKTEEQIARDLSTSRSGPFTRLVRLGLRRPWLTAALLLPLAGLSYVGYRGVGSGFMPAVDEGGFVLDYRAPAGTSLTETDRRLREVEKILRSTPEVRTYSRRTGVALGGGLTEANEGDFFVRLKPLPRRNIWAVMDEVRWRVERTVPGLQIEMALLMEDLIGDLTAVPQPIEVKIFGDDNKALEKTARSVAEKIGKISGVVDVKSGVVLAGDAVDIIVDRDKASLEGIDPGWVTKEVDALLSGQVSTQIQKGPKMIGVRVWTPKSGRDTVEALGQLRLRAPDGHMVPLRRIARLKPVTGQPQLSREDFKRMVAVTGRISGRDMGSTVRDVKRALNTPGTFPKSQYYRLGGLYSQQRKAFHGLIIVFAAAVGLVFTLLLFLYRSFRIATVMMVPALFGAGAAFLGLWLTGIELNITAMMGMTMVIGIVTEVSIFYMSEFTEQSDGSLDERLVLAAQERVRPIAMTTIATILALAPLALAIGEGAALLQPLAVAIIAGLLIQMPLVLVFLPALLKFTSPKSAKQGES